MSSKLLKGLLVLSLFAIFGVKANAQALSQYVVSESIGSWQPITGTQILGSGDDGTTGLIDIGFTFPYDNRTFTQYSASQNVFITLGYNNTNYYTAPGTLNDYIAPQRADNYTDGNIVSELQGSAPNRVRIIQWNNYRGLGQGAGINAQCQVRLYENGMIQMIYGPNCPNIIDRSEYTFVSGQAGYYIRIQPGTPTEYYYNNNSGYSYIPGTNNSLYVQGLTYTIVGYPQLTAAYPAPNSVLLLGSTYELPSNLHPGVSLMNYQASIPTYVQYSISGPGNSDNPDWKEIYQATVEGNLNDTLVQLLGNGIYRFTEARRIGAKTTPTNNGGIDLVTNRTQIKGGEYTVNAKMVLPTVGYTQSYKHTFNIALENDINLTEVYHPKLKKAYELALGQCNVSCKVTNVGFNPVSSFDVFATFYKKNSTGQWVYLEEDTLLWRNTDTPLLNAQFTNITFDNFQFRGAGDYKVVYRTTMNGVVDDDPANNIYPRAGADAYEFSVAYSVELFAQHVYLPKGNLNYVGVPIRPTVSFGNKGTNDTSDVTVFFTIHKMLPGGGLQQVYGPDNAIIKDIPFGSYGIGYFNDWVPTEEGCFVSTYYINMPQDPNPADNSIKDTFCVEGALCGTYTIGTRYLGNARNYQTISDAVSDLYLRGINCSITFELTDASYNEGDLSDIYQPAIDLSSKIMGVIDGNEIRTITFKPDIDRGMNNNSIVINLTPGNGVGINFGQNTNPKYTHAPVYKVRVSKIKDFATSDGYITFNGGTNKSIRFNMNTNSNFRAAMFLGNGASNITVKNCIFTDGNVANPSSACTLPLSRYSTSQNRFEFQDDNQTDGTTYSSAIALHSITPINKKTQANTYGLDTLVNTNVKIEDNVISGFSYGIVSLGAGPLIDQYLGAHIRYYNTANSYKNNTIFNIKRAGIFLGFEENSDIINNRIFNVGGSCGDDAAGIILGGDDNAEFYGYNNINIYVNQNEISQITHPNAAYGIKIEQCFNQYLLGDFLVDFPNADDNMKITNNMIWEVSTTNTNNLTSEKSGIRVMETSPSQIRSANNDLSYIYYVPRNGQYHIQNTFIANNTVRIDYANASSISGISLSNVTNTSMFNNAIAIKAAGTPASNNNVIMRSCVHYQGQMPGTNALISDRNAYEIDANVYAGSVFSFIETNELSQPVDWSIDFRADYKTIFQWQNWTNQDMNSYFGNFTQDMAFNPVDNYQVYRVITTPIPVGSILNNHGQLLFTEVPVDIDGNVRGQGGQRFDIGACEFQGQLYSEDLSIENITEPRKYQKGSGEFADAEYIMQEPPFNITAVAKNNGMQPRAGVVARCVLSLEQPNGAFAPIDTVDQVIQIAPNGVLEINYSLPSNPTVPFPKTYTEFNTPDVIYAVPARFAAMARNVTPLYKIRVELLASEVRNDNNSFEKIVRYFVPKSNLGMLLSLESPLAPITGTQDEKAGRLNSDSLKNTLAGVGFVYDLDSENNYDIFDRNGWEEKAVNYKLYSTLWWSDGDDKSVANTDKISRYMRDNLRDFIAAGEVTSKKNLIIGSQEMSRELLTKTSINYDSLFVSSLLRVNADTVANPTNPLGVGATYHGNTVQGVDVGRGTSATVARTGVAGDAEPMPGLLRINNTGDAVAYKAYKYTNYLPTANDSLMGVAISGTTKNIIYLAVDWRHWQNSDRIIRPILDFLGNDIPVELVNFEAIKLNNRVELNWKTVTEVNTDRFEVERAVRNSAGITSFSQFANVEAKGTNGGYAQYGPVVDRNVALGNSYVYRLKMVDLDGTYEYSDQVEVDYNYDGILSIERINPNPIQNAAEVKFLVASDSRITISIYSSNGQLVKEVLNKDLSAGEHNIGFDMNGFSAGSYTIVVSDGIEISTKTIQVVK